MTGRVFDRSSRASSEAQAPWPAEDSADMSAAVLRVPKAVPTPTATSQAAS